MYDIFSLPPIQFPKEFLWGSATAAYQIEGDNVHAALWAREAELKWTPSGKACNSYALYREDIALLQRLGHQVYRFSINWSRIEPSDGQWNAEGIEHYVDLCRRLCAVGIKPFITLYHGEHPEWFEQIGGWKKPDNLHLWERFVTKMAPLLAPFAAGWVVLNEFNGGFGGDSAQRKYLMMKAHAVGFHILKQFSKAPVGTAHAFIHWQPRRYHDKLDHITNELNDWMQNEFFFHAIRTGEFVYPGFDAKHDPLFKDSIDYWAVNMYTRHMSDARTARGEGAHYVHKTLPLINADFWFKEFFPECMVSNLERLADKPVIITENGAACKDDRFRIVYLALHLCALREAMDRGVDVRGYFHWSLMDNWEWGSLEPQFGLCQVDFTTFERTPRPSAWFFKDVIANGGFHVDVIRKYLTELPSMGAGTNTTPTTKAAGEMWNAYSK